jgi:HlyD family secretion protein
MNLNAPDSIPTVTPEEFLPPVSGWLTGGGIALLTVLGGATVLAALLPYPVTIKAAATVRPDGDLRLVEATLAGTVAEIRVKANDRVNQGAILAVLRDDALTTKQQELRSDLQAITAQLTQGQRRMLALQAQIGAEKETTARSLAAASHRLEDLERSYQDHQATTRSDLRAAQARVGLAQEELKRYNDLAARGALGELQVQEKQAALDTALATLDRTQALVNPSDASLTQTRQEIAQIQARGRATLAELDQKQTQLAQDQSDLQRQRQVIEQRLGQIDRDLARLTLRAPVTGVIQDLALRNPGQVLSAGEVVAHLAPAQAPLLVKALVNQNDISQIKPGQGVTLRIDSCVYTDFGTLPGVITAIAPDVQGTGQGARYGVSIHPQTTTLYNGDRPCALQAGMEGQAHIPLRAETILSFWWRKLRLGLGE